MADQPETAADETTETAADETTETAADETTETAAAPVSSRKKRRVQNKPGKAQPAGNVPEALKPGSTFASRAKARQAKS